MRIKFMDGCSSEWSYFTPYEADISTALQQLREDVFARGDYMTEESEIASYRDLQDVPHPSAFKPASIGELLEQEGDRGTHSILDITHVSPTPKRRAVSPLPASVLADYFSSDKPSREEIEDVYEFGSLEKYVDKSWRGIYIIAYADGKPSEIFFAGCSGD
jgi:hypothetical protein